MYIIVIILEIIPQFYIEWGTQLHKKIRTSKANRLLDNRNNSLNRTPIRTRGTTSIKSHSIMGRDWFLVLIIVEVIMMKFRLMTHLTSLIWIRWRISPARFLLALTDTISSQTPRTPGHSAKAHEYT